MLHCMNMCHMVHNVNKRKVVQTSSLRILILYQIRLHI